MVAGTKNDFFNACATCCNTDGTPMPYLNGLNIRVAPCQTVDITDVNGNPYMVFGIPTIIGGQNYFPYGIHNNVPFTLADPNGYSSLGNLLTFLNTNWTPYVWTLSADNYTLIATGGTLDDSLCVSVIAITPSV